MRFTPPPQPIILILTYDIIVSRRRCVSYDIMLQVYLLNIYLYARVCFCCRRVSERKIRRGYRGEGHQTRTIADPRPEVQSADGQRSRLHRRLTQLLYQERDSRLYRYKNYLRNTSLLRYTLLCVSIIIQPIK